MFHGFKMKKTSLHEHDEKRAHWAKCALAAAVDATGITLSDEQENAAIEAMKPEIAIVFVKHQNRTADERAVFAAAFAAYISRETGDNMDEPGPEHEDMAREAVAAGRTAVLWYRLGVRSPMMVLRLGTGA